MDGYLFFDDITPATRDALFELVEEELLRVAAMSVSGSAGAFVGYEANDPRAAYATVEAVAEAVGRPAQRLLRVTPRTDLPAPAPGHRDFADGTAVALVLLPVPLARAEEVAHVVARLAGEGAIGVAVVLGGHGTVLVEIDGESFEHLQSRLADVLAVAAVPEADVMITSGALGRGWATGTRQAGQSESAGSRDRLDQADSNGQGAGADAGPGRGQAAVTRQT